MRLRSVLVLTTVLAGSLSCASRVTAPPVVPSEDIRFELVVSGGAAAGEPVTLRAVIWNAGSATAFPVDPCPDPYIRIFDAGRKELFQRDPTMPVACPLVLPAPLEPGSRLERSLSFAGRYYGEQGDPLVAPPGTYAAVATIRYSIALSRGGWSELRTLTREVAFTWR